MKEEQHVRKRPDFEADLEVDRDLAGEKGSQSSKQTQNLRH